MSKFDRFYSYLEELEQSYGRLSDLLRQKLIAVDQFNIDKLDEIMKEEQVYVLLSKGFEGNIASYKEELSLTGETLSRCIQQMPEEEHGRFQDQFSRLDTVLAEVKGLNEKCQTLIEERLYTIDKTIKAMDKTESSVYRQTGGTGLSADQTSRLFTKTV